MESAANSTNGAGKGICIQFKMILHTGSRKASPASSQKMT